MWVCPSCDGRAVSLEVIRKVVPQSVVKELWQRTLYEEITSKARCPVCTRRMSVVTLSVQEKKKYLDVCQRCRFIWFDPHEFEELPLISSEKPPREDLPLEGREALALARLEALKERQELREIGPGAPDHWWEVILGYFGMPVEYNARNIRNTPVITWTLSVLILIVTIASLYNLEAVVKNWGLIPDQFTRHFGLTFISSFFLHAGLIHLMGNLYFLMIFGDNVEDVLGKQLYVLLIMFSALAGDLAHILSEPGAATPVIGASGGISGVLAYYCLRFPRAKVGVLWWLRWIRIPVGWMLGLWTLGQIIGALRQISGFESVSALAHLGGAAVGVLFGWGTTHGQSKRVVGSETAMNPDVQRPPGG